MWVCEFPSRQHFSPSPYPPPSFPSSLTQQFEGQATVCPVFGCCGRDLDAFRVIQQGLAHPCQGTADVTSVGKGPVWVVRVGKVRRGGNEGNNNGTSLCKETFLKEKI